MNRNVINEYQMKYNPDHEIILHITRTYDCEFDKIENLEDIKKLIIEIYDLENVVEEYSYVIAFDLKMDILGILPLSHGNDDRCIMDAKVIYRFLLLIGANQFVLFHNHSSNVMEMSEADAILTDEIYQASCFLNIKMLEHIIICKSGTVNCLEQLRNQELTLEDVI